MMNINRDALDFLESINPPPERPVKPDYIKFDPHVQVWNKDDWDDLFSGYPATTTFGYGADSNPDEYARLLIDALARGEPSSITVSIDEIPHAALPFLGNIQAESAMSGTTASAIRESAARDRDRRREWNALRNDAVDAARYMPQHISLEEARRMALEIDRLIRKEHL